MDMGCIGLGFCPNARFARSFGCLIAVCAAVPLIGRFKALGHPVYTACRDVRIED